LKRAVFIERLPLPYMYAFTTLRAPMAGWRPQRLSSTCSRCTATPKAPISARRPSQPLRASVGRPPPSSQWSRISQPFTTPLPPAVACPGGSTGCWLKRTADPELRSHSAPSSVCPHTGLTADALMLRALWRSSPSRLACAPPPSRPARLREAMGAATCRRAMEWIATRTQLASAPDLILRAAEKGAPRQNQEICHVVSYLRARAHTMPLFLPHCLRTDCRATGRYLAGNPRHGATGRFARAVSASAASEHCRHDASIARSAADAMGMAGSAWMLSFSLSPPFPLHMELLLL